MTPALRILPLAVLVALAACDRGGISDPEDPAPPLGVVLVIGDGMGDGSLHAARLAKGGALTLELPIRGRVSTASASDSITDSAAGATALATGVRTYNGAVGVAPDGGWLETVLEVAERRGMATGLVATSSVVHATPAAFAAHVPDRYLYYDIAAQMAASGVDVLLGGGAGYFRPDARPDGVDLAEALRGRGCRYLESEAELPSVGEASSLECLVGLLFPDGLPPMPARGPLLERLVSLALAVVAQDPEGFFLMVEGSQIDWAQHANDGQRSVAETLDLDAAVGVILDKLSNRPNTLVIVTADHETGGMWAEIDPATGELAFSWSTMGHTAQAVPLHATGTGSSLFGGEMENREVGSSLLSLVRDAVRPR